MWWFAATLRKGGGEGPHLHLLQSTMSRSSTYKQNSLPRSWHTSVLKLRVRFSNEMSTRCPIGHCDTALMRHTFRNECNEANLEPVSDTPTTCPVRFPLADPA